MRDDTTPDGTLDTPAPDTPAPTGRPRVWTLDDLAEVPRLMEAEGISLRAACRRLSIPPSRFIENLPAFPALGEMYAKVRPHVGAEYARRSQTAVERAWDMVTDPNVDAKRGNAIAAAGRNLSERYAWIAGRVDPAGWGDKVQHEGTVKVEAVVLLPPLQPVPLPPAPTVTATLLPSGSDAETVPDEG